MATEIVEADTLNLFFFSDGTQIDKNECLESPKILESLAGCCTILCKIGFL